MVCCPAQKKTAENPSLSIALTDPVRQAADVEPDAAGSSAKTTGGEDGTSGPLEPVSPTRPAGSVRIDAPPASTTNTDGNDALDPELFAIFREEAQALIPQLNAVVRQWSARPDNEGARQKPCGCSTPSRAVHARLAPCGWAPWLMKWSRPSAKSGGPATMSCPGRCWSPCKSGWMTSTDSSPCCCKRVTPPKFQRMARQLQQKPYSVTVRPHLPALLLRVLQKIPQYCQA